MKPLGSDNDEAPIDWVALAVEVDCLRDGVDVGCGSEQAKRALSILIGDARVRAAVDWYLDYPHGCELARLVLAQIQPQAARDRCLEIWRSDTAIDHRRAAVELFRVLATSDDLPLVDEFLADPDPSVQNWGISVLDTLVWSGWVEPVHAEPYVARAEQHPNHHVRERCSDIREDMIRKSDC